MRAEAATLIGGALGSVATASCSAFRLASFRVAGLCSFSLVSNLDSCLALPLVEAKAGAVVLLGGALGGEGSLE